MSNAPDQIGAEDIKDREDRPYIGNQPAAAAENMHDMIVFRMVAAAQPTGDRFPVAQHQADQHERDHQPETSLDAAIDAVGNFQYQVVVGDDVAIGHQIDKSLDPAKQIAREFVGKLDQPEPGRCRRQDGACGDHQHQASDCRIHQGPAEQRDGTAVPISE